jgi:uncharacterized protein (TIGR02646 family)
MKKVVKSLEPEELKTYKQQYITQFRRWEQAREARVKVGSGKNAKKVKIKDVITSTLIADQKGLCAYCEMTIHENFSVEHFIPCHLSTKQKNYDLDWQNMLGNCSPPGGLLKEDLQNSQIPHEFPCCGKAKNEFIPDGQLLNPLELPTSRLFRFRSRDGEMMPDETACEQAGIAVVSAQFTIDILNLNADRLKRHRKTVIDEINQEIFERQDEIDSQVLLEKQIASERLSNSKNQWSKFFTTIRWILGEGAEKHLSSISYMG